MAILIDAGTPFLIQGLTGRQGSFHARLMQEYGTRVVAGVTPGRGGERWQGLPVYDSVRRAVRETGARASVSFVPASAARSAALEAIDAGLELLVQITEGIPVHDTLDILALAEERGCLVIGPNTFGVIVPGRAKAGIMPGEIYRPGPVGLVARSGTLSYEIARNLVQAGLGISTAVGLGGDPVVGQSFVGILKEFGADPETRAVVLVGEIGGTAEEEAVAAISSLGKPVVGYLAGRSAPPGRRMGHAGAIIEGGRGGWESKAEAWRGAGATVVELPWEVAPKVESLLAGAGR